MDQTQEASMSTDIHVTPPGERFNFAQHLLGLNAVRPTKTVLSITWAP